MRAPHGPGMEDAALAGILRAGSKAAFAPTCLDRELLAVCDAAVHRRLPLVLVLPLAAPDTAVTLAAAAIVSAVVHRRDLSASVAVAARNLASATSYDRFFMRDQQLAQFVSRARVGPDGKVTVVRRGQSAAGRLYVSTSLERLTPLLPGLDAVVVDSTADRGSFQSLTGMLLSAPTQPSDAAAHTGRPVLVYLTRSPLDPAIELLGQHDAIIWGWDNASAGALSNAAELIAPPLGTIAGSAGAVTVPGPVLRASSAARVHINAPTPGAATGFDDALTTLWRSVSALAGTYNAGATRPRGPGNLAGGVADRVSGSALRWLWCMFHVAATLPVPADRYDEHVSSSPYMPATRLADVARVAREYARSTTGERREAWYEVANAFEGVIRLDPGKFPALVEWVNRIATRDGRGLVAVRDRASVAAVSEAISASPDAPDRWEERVRVVRVADLPTVMSDRAWLNGQDEGQVGGADVCLTGTLPKAAAGLFAAPPGPSLTVLVAGPREAARVNRTATHARKRMGEIRWEAVEVSAVLLDVAPGAAYVRAEPSAGIDLGEYDGQLAEDDEPNPWDPFSDDVGQLIFELLSEVASSPEPTPAPVRFNDEGEAQATTDAVVVRVRDSVGRAAWMAVEPNDLVTRRRRERMERVAGKSLQVGDELLLVDQQARRDLLSAVLEKLSESTAYSTLMLLIDLWHERAALVRESDMTYGEVLRRMGGTSITSESTIGSWVRADVEGPMDKKDLERFAKAVGDHRLAVEAERVGWALTTRHRVHRKAGAWLSAQLDGATMNGTDATVDAALNIHVADLLEAVTAWTIEQVDPNRLSVDVSVLGLLLTEVDVTVLRHSATARLGEAERAQPDPV